MEDSSRSSEPDGLARPRKRCACNSFSIPKLPPPQQSVDSKDLESLPKGNSGDPMPLAKSSSGGPMPAAPKPVPTAPKPAPTDPNPMSTDPNPMPTNQKLLLESSSRHPMPKPPSFVPSNTIKTEQRLLPPSQALAVPWTPVKPSSLLNSPCLSDTSHASRPLPRNSGPPALSKIGEISQESIQNLVPQAENSSVDFARGSSAQIPKITEVLRLNDAQSENESDISNAPSRKPAQDALHEEAAGEDGDDEKHDCRSLSTSSSSSSSSSSPSPSPSSSSPPSPSSSTSSTPSSSSSSSSSSSFASSSSSSKKAVKYECTCGQRGSLLGLAKHNVAKWKEFVFSLPSDYGPTESFEELTVATLRSILRACATAKRTSELRKAELVNVMKGKHICDVLIRFERSDEFNLPGVVLEFYSEADPEYLGDPSHWIQRNLRDRSLTAQDVRDLLCNIYLPEEFDMNRRFQKGTPQSDCGSCEEFTTAHDVALAQKKSEKALQSKYLKDKYQRQYNQRDLVEKVQRRVWIERMQVGQRDSKKNRLRRSHPSFRYNVGINPVLPLPRQEAERQKVLPLRDGHMQKQLLGKHPRSRAVQRPAPTRSIASNNGQCSYTARISNVGHSKSHRQSSVALNRARALNAKDAHDIRLQSSTSSSNHFPKAAMFQQPSTNRHANLARARCSTSQNSSFSANPATWNNEACQAPAQQRSQLQCPVQRSTPSAALPSVPPRQVFPQVLGQQNQGARPRIACAPQKPAHGAFSMRLSPAQLQRVREADEREQRDIQRALFLSLSEQEKDATKDRKRRRNEIDLVSPSPRPRAKYRSHQSNDGVSTHKCRRTREALMEKDHPSNLASSSSHGYQVGCNTMANDSSSSSSSSATRTPTPRSTPIANLASGVTPLAGDAYEREEEEEEEDDVNLCQICLEVPRDTCLVPCGHFFYCATCVASLIECPTCRQRIAIKQRIFY